MVNPRKKTETLSETTKTFLLDVYIEEVFGRVKDTSNKFCEKGTEVEENSISLLTEVTGEFFVKNEKEISNEFVVGTPDVTKNKVVDIKSSWDIWTFAQADGNNKDYYWQLQCYMWLTGMKLAELAYCLVNSPEHLIFDEKQRQMYKQGLIGQEGTPEFDAMEKQVELNMTYDDISKELRVKRFSFEYDEKAIETLKQRIIFAREYLSSLSLK